MWEAAFCAEFVEEFGMLSVSVQDKLVAHARLLEQFGPRLGRAFVDELQGSRYAIMKELRFEAENGIWRVASAFDPNRKGILLADGDNSGQSDSKFYRQLTANADERFRAEIDQVDVP